MELLELKLLELKLLLNCWCKMPRRLMKWNEMKWNEMKWYEMIKSVSRVTKVNIKLDKIR